MAETTNPVNVLEEQGRLRGLRAYAERVIFTQRGRFAFIAFLLMVIDKRIGSIRMEGIASASWSPVTNAGFMESMMQSVGIGLTVLVSLMGGMLVLMAIDMYDHHIGTVYDE